MTISIEIKDLSKKYKLYQSRSERFKDLVLPKSYGKDFWALRHVDFRANKGDVIGFIGINGSGKSTLSNIIAGIVPESSGSIYINGQASLIAVSSGLKGDLTGRENIELKCLMLGFSMKEIKEMQQWIIEFAELEDFIDQPVKSYSSGMKSRLGFAISVTIDPDILIIDEALSVGDKAFAEKSIEKMKEFKAQGKTMIFVSHSINQIKNFCNKVLWLEFGQVKKYGNVDDIIPEYENFIKEYKKMTKKQKSVYKRKVIENQTVRGNK
ncbi:teichoic acids export ATP-binding protein TagH [Halolactibacillus alkaliphilus]|uniref:Teichoic acids export ATP-binding protein TagH n=1 Tax=Halolactibacillus alkaliphilus TaxID=442899 RepID=A0A511X540_9BACI|nr:teichoic acids export ABC transporter ATP-binding subunit TagH [Halolactibacillus alkaliphilus]GEN58054.1 teichoic acids export ATP-binding protein TagH [Halolactibacillus alkaliphilus]GGN76302.1 teichoic acids export ATP-binding protein TagH [Halolactibacillus alkaliphilus]SFP13421.1 teichoic acid transport system ATP-binding protein [Halolactibacillus alkaliphilus]